MNISVSLFSNVFSFTNENDQHIKDKIAFQVINDLHSEMDINKDGEINSNEAEEVSCFHYIVEFNINNYDTIRKILLFDFNN